MCQRPRQSTHRVAGGHPYWRACLLPRLRIARYTARYTEQGSNDAHGETNNKSSMEEQPALTVVMDHGGGAEGGRGGGAGKVHTGIRYHRQVFSYTAVGEP